MVRQIVLVAMLLSISGFNVRIQSVGAVIGPYALGFTRQQTGIYIMSIQSLILSAKSQALQVYAPVNLTSYFYVTDGINIGYCQFDNVQGERFGTVHKPCHENGTGFMVDKLEEVFITKPIWSYSLAKIIKYKSFNDFQSSHWSKLVEY
jgi:hypothetical protein